MKNTVLVIIDPQNDFMDSPNYMGSLAVPGAYEDTLRLIKKIENDSPQDIVVTLDTHARLHIAHPLWWENSAGENPNPFTLITVEDIKNGVWKASDSEMQDYSASYAQQLLNQGKYELRIWPFHCIDQTQGHEVEMNLLQALNNWEKVNNRKVQYVRKGTNPKTEHYSVFKAEVIDEKDEATKLNTTLIDFINMHDKVEFAGQAASHCVAGSVIDYLENVPLKDREKVTVLKDCTSAVPGYEQAAQDFFTKVVQMGSHIMNATDSKKLKM